MRKLILFRKLQKEEDATKDLCDKTMWWNLNMELARQTLQILERPMERQEIVSIQEKAENIARLKQIELARNTKVMAARNFQVDDGNLTFQLWNTYNILF